jgi:signal transduction histidine kinase
MRHSIIAKFLAFFLAALSLAGAVAGAAGIVAMENAGLYVNGLEELQDQKCEDIASSVAQSFTKLYAVDTFGNLNYTLRRDLYTDPEERGDAEYWCVKLEKDGEVLADPGDVSAYSMSWSYEIAPYYPIVSRQSPYDQEKPEVTQPDPTSPTSSPRGSQPGSFEGVEVPKGYLYYDTLNRWENGSITTYYLYYFEAPAYTVTVYLQPEVLESSSLHILTGIYPYRYWFIAVLVLGLVLFAVCTVFLCWSAGVTKDGTVRPGGLNRLPLDLYAALAAAGITGLVVLFARLLEWVSHEGPHPGNLSLLMVNLLGIIVLAEAFLFAFCAQVKVKGAFWWHHSVIGWTLGKLFRGIRFLFRAVGKVFGMMNIIWQWLLTAALMVLAAGISFLIAVISVNNGGDLQAIIGVLQFPVVALFCIGVVFYGGYAFGTLLLGARKMAQGDLSHKISTKYLYGGFRECAEQMNSLSDTAMKEAQNRLKSERMKTELITNVSHDIKTPLTSIINFVDLLRKPHTEEERQQYLEVLSRQSDRMKRLIEDLIALSKATTGNIQVNITCLDAVEAVQQALGEFSDKLEAVSLTPVFRHPEGRIPVMADGRQMWRVLSNLLTNAVKYAMPGTRLYLDLSRNEGWVQISLKNISREELKASAEELLERFVQGDSSRSTEGSGLGLNIAQSLMELQGGTMQIHLDGDLFKVVLSFRAGE